MSEGEIGGCIWKREEARWRICPKDWEEDTKKGTAIKTSVKLTEAG